MRKSWFLLAAVSFLAFQMTGCQRNKAEKMQEKVVKVSVAPLTYRTFQYKIPVQGTVYSAEYAVISARTGGTVDSLPAYEGAHMKKGDLLFVIDQKTLADQVIVSTKELAVARSEYRTAKIAAGIAGVRLRKAKQDYERASRLFERRAISLDAMESAEVVYEVAKSEMEKANAAMEYRNAKMEQQASALEIAKKNLEDSAVLAPYDCVVTDQYVEPREYVHAGSQIIRIENQSTLKVRCYLSSIYYHYIQEGKTKVEFFLDGKPAGKAVVSYRSPNIDPVSRTFKIKIVLPKDTPLVSGLLCDMVVILDEHAGAGVPADALLLRDQDRYAAFIADKDGRAVEVTVHRGITDGRWCELVDAAKFKDARFIVSGQTFVNRGDKLDILPAAETTPAPGMKP